MQGRNKDLISDFQGDLKEATDSGKLVIIVDPPGAVDTLKNVAEVAIPGLGLFLLTKRAGADNFITASEARSIGLELAMTAFDVIPAPIKSAARAGITVTRTVAPVKAGGGFISETTPAPFVPALRGGPADESLLEASEALRLQKLERGSGEVVLGDRVVTFRQTELDRAIREANPDAPGFSATAAPDVAKFEAGGTIPEFNYPPSLRDDAVLVPEVGDTLPENVRFALEQPENPRAGMPKPAQEQFQFRTPGAEGVLKFSDRSAFGATGDTPGIAIYRTGPEDVEIPGAPSEPLGVNYYHGRELEVGVPSGEVIPPVERVAGIGSAGVDDLSKGLYLEEGLQAPSYGQRVSANLRALVDQRPLLSSRPATADEIANARFGKNASELTEAEADYVSKAQQSDDALQSAADAGDSNARLLLDERGYADELAGRQPGAGRVGRDVEPPRIRDRVAEAAAGGLAARASRRDGDDEPEVDSATRERRLDDEEELPGLRLETGGDRFGTRGQDGFDPGRRSAGFGEPPQLRGGAPAEPDFLRAPRTPEDTPHGRSALRTPRASRLRKFRLAPRRASPPCARPPASRLRKFRLAPRRASPPAHAPGEPPPEVPPGTPPGEPTLRTPPGEPPPEVPPGTPPGEPPPPTRTPPGIPPPRPEREDRPIPPRTPPPGPPPPPLLPPRRPRTPTREKQEEVKPHEPGTPIPEGYYARVVEVRELYSDYEGPGGEVQRTLIASDPAQVVAIDGTPPLMRQLHVGNQIVDVRDRVLSSEDRPGLAEVGRENVRPGARLEEAIFVRDLDATETTVQRQRQAAERVIASMPDPEAQRQSRLNAARAALGQAAGTVRGAVAGAIDAAASAQEQYQAVADASRQERARQARDVADAQLQLDAAEQELQRARREQGPG